MKSSQRLQKALEEMNTSDFSDTTVKAGSLNVAFDSLRQSIRQLSGMLNSKQKRARKPDLFGIELTHSRPDSDLLEFPER